MSFNVLLLIVLLFLSSLYVPLNRRASKYYWKTWFDSHIPLIPIFVLPYVAFFPFIPATIYILWGSLFETPLLLSIIIARITSMIFWYAFPNGVLRPEILPHSWLHKVLGIIYRNDKDTNAFPSDHVYTSLICGYFLALGYPNYALYAWGCALLIAVSTLFTKQHHVVDLFGGVLVMICSIAISSLSMFKVY